MLNRMMEGSSNPATRVPSPKPRRLARAAAIGMALSGFCAVFLYARHAMGTTFGEWDDEGYVLLALDHYLKGGKLYTEVFSSFGPFFFHVQALLFRVLHLSVNHNNGRLVALLYWLAATLLAGGFVYKISRNLFAVAAAMLACGLSCRALAQEPGHAQQLVLLVLMLGCFVASTELRAGIRLFVLGGLGSALLFTKINTGVFFLAALAGTLILLLPRGRARNLGLALLGFYAVCGPIVLMHSNLRQWALGYCVVAVLCGATTFFIGSRVASPSEYPVQSVLWAAAGVIAVAAYVVMAARLQGLPFPALMDGVLWAPLGQANIFSMPIGIGKASTAGALLVSCCVLALYFLRARQGRWMDLADTLRCPVGMLALTILAVQVAHLQWMVPFLPIALIPRDRQPWTAAELFPRLFVTALAATEFLQAYPVAGSQLRIANAPMILWGFLCVHDGAPALLRKLSAFAKGWRGAPAESIAGLALASVMVCVMWRTGSFSWRYEYPASSLRGASILHLPPTEEARYSYLTNRISANCVLLFGLPQIGSLNLWSGVAPPNGLDIDIWMTSYSIDQQNSILRILQSNPQGCAVYNPHLVGVWGVTKDQLARSPLARYIAQEMRPAVTKDSYEIRVNPGRTMPWVDSGDARTSMLAR